MIFQRAEPSHSYRALRLVSEGGRWELGLHPYHSGTRIRMGLSGRPPSVIDFCLGHDASLYAPVLLAVMELLQGAPESADAGNLDALFPWAGTRPDPGNHLPMLLGQRAPQRLSLYSS